MSVNEMNPPKRIVSLFSCLFYGFLLFVFSFLLKAFNPEETVKCIVRNIVRKANLTNRIIFIVGTTICNKNNAFQKCRKVC